jgi:hypothetical protein
MHLAEVRLLQGAFVQKLRNRKQGRGECPFEWSLFRQNAQKMNYFGEQNNITMCALHKDIISCSFSRIYI